MAITRIKKERVVKSKKHIRAKKVKEVIIERPRKIEHKPVKKESGIAGSDAGASLACAAAVADPFGAFSRGTDVPMPFDEVVAPTYSFWTRTIFQVADQQFGATATGGSFVVVAPWISPQYVDCSSLNTSGLPVTPQFHSDPNLSTYSTAFETIVVTAQAMRVRNLTAVLGQAGEQYIGTCSYLDAISNDYYKMRNNNASYAKMGGDPGVYMQLSYVGNSSTNFTTTSAADYKFTDVSVTALAGDTTVMIFRSTGTFVDPQSYEVEVVTHYLARPFSNQSSMYPVKSRSVYPQIVAKGLSEIWTKSPRFSKTSCAAKDDGADYFWNTAKSVVKGAGNDIINTVAGWASSTWSSLFGAKRRNHAFKRLISLLPDEHFDEFAELINTHKTLGQVKDELDKRLRSLDTAANFTRYVNTLTPNQIEVMLGFDQDDDLISAPASSPRSITTAAKPAVSRGYFR